MHWAAIGGNIEACTVLAQAGTMEDLMVTDKSGCTPKQLASDNGHKRLVILFVSTRWILQMLYTIYTLKQAVDFNMLTLQSNAERVLKNRGDDKSPLGRIKKLGLVPILWVVNISMIVIYINSVIICKFVFHWLCMGFRLLLIIRLPIILFSLQHPIFSWYQQLLEPGPGYLFFLQQLDLFCYIDAAGNTLNLS